MGCSAGRQLGSQPEDREAYGLERVTCSGHGHGLGPGPQGSNPAPRPGGSALAEGKSRGCPDEVRESQDSEKYPSPARSDPGPDSDGQGWLRASRGHAPAPLTPRPPEGHSAPGVCSRPLGNAQRSPHEGPPLPVTPLAAVERGRVGGRSSCCGAWSDRRPVRWGLGWRVGTAVCGRGPAPAEEGTFPGADGVAPCPRPSLGLEGSMLLPPPPREGRRVQTLPPSNRSTLVLAGARNQLPCCPLEGRGPPTAGL